MIDLLISDIDCVITTPYEKPLGKASIAIDNGNILEIGKSEDLDRRYEARRVISGVRKLAHAGLIDLHCHANQQLARGLTDNLDIRDWIVTRIYPYENAQTYEDVRVAALACCLELVRSGTTCFVDPGAFHPDAVCDAAETVGVRGVVATPVMDVFSGDRPVDVERRPGVDEIIQEVADYIVRVRARESRLVRPSIGLRSESMVSDDLARRTKQLANSEDVLIQCHVAGQRFPVEEHRKMFGSDPVPRLAATGVLSHRFLAAHCVHIGEADVDTLASTDTAVTYCPTSSNIIAAAHTQCGRHAAMVKAGVRVGLGADSAPASNSMDLFRVMASVTVQRDIHEDASLFPARHIFDMATRIGASAAGWRELGVLSSGSPADIVLHDLDRPELIPLHDPVSNLVHSASGASVRTVVIDGRVVLDEGVFPHVDEVAILRQAQDTASDLAIRAGIAV